MVIDPTAMCQTPHVGEGTRVDAMAFVHPSAILGSDCHIEAHAHIGAGVVLADRVRVGCGARLAHNIDVGADVVVGAGVIIAPEAPEQRIRLGHNCAIGPGAVVTGDVNVGEHAVIRAGAVAQKAAPAWSIIEGNPGRVVAFNTPSVGAERTAETKRATQVQASRVRGVRFIAFPQIADPRGNLTVGDAPDLPFSVKRFFIVSDVPGRHLRGEHAHRRCSQLLLAVRGRCAVVVDDGDAREEFELDSPHLGLLVPPMVWALQYKHSADSTLLVLASDPYDATDYIRTYDEFVELVRKATV